MREKESHILQMSLFLLGTMISLLYEVQRTKNGDSPRNKNQDIKYTMIMLKCQNTCIFKSQFSSLLTITIFCDDINIELYHSPCSIKLQARLQYCSLDNTQTLRFIMTH